MCDSSWASDMEVGRKWATSEAHVSDPSSPLQLVTPIKKTGPGTLGGYAPFLSVSKQRTVPRRTREAIGRY